MDILSINQKNLIISAYDGSVKSVSTRTEAILLLRNVNELCRDLLISDDCADMIRRAVMVAFDDIDSLEAYSLSGNLSQIIDSRKRYQESLINAFVDKVERASTSADKRIYLVRGMTASGKSTYAMQLRDKLGACEIVETDQVKEVLFSDLWSQGAGVCPEPRQLHKEAALICKTIVDVLCERGVSFILVQRFEKVEDAQRIIGISERYGYSWNIYSITPDYVDIARNSITRSRSLLNINTFSPGSLLHSLTKYTTAASFFYRLTSLPCVSSMCDVRQQAKGTFVETYYKKDGSNIYVNSNPSIHSPLLSSKAVKEIEDYAIFSSSDMPRYENFFQRGDEDGVEYRRTALRALRAISRSANGTIDLSNKDKHTNQSLSAFYQLHSPADILTEAVNYIYNRRFARIDTKEDLENFIIEIALRVTGLSKETVFRTNETGKYILPQHIPTHFEEFISKLLDALKTERNRIYVASYIVWSIDFTGHYFADGCSRISTLLAQWYLMRTGSSLPDMARRLDHEPSIRTSYRKRHHMTRDEIYDLAVNKQRFKQFYKYYKSLFVKSSRPTIPCAGGYIFNQKGQVLLLRSAKGKDIGKFVVPGGKIGRGESPEQAFIREVQEEAGISIDNIVFIGKRHYMAPSGRRYVMYDFTAQTNAVNVSINSESVESEWIFPIDIQPSECTKSTINGLDRYLSVVNLTRMLENRQIARMQLPKKQAHATGLLENAYVEKKLSGYSWALSTRPDHIVFHGLLPLRSVIDSVLSATENVEIRSGLADKDRNSNALRPVGALDRNGKTLHLFNIPGDDILRHYALLLHKHQLTTGCAIDIVRYPDVDKDLFRLTGLSNKLVRGGDVVYLGYSTRLKEYLQVNSFKCLSVVESFWYISSRFDIGGQVLNVLECKFGHWGDISASLSRQLCGLGVSAIIHSGKVGTLVDQSEVYNRVYIPNAFAVYNHEDEEINFVAIDNMLSSFIPFQSNGHVSCSTPLDETDRFVALTRKYKIESVDIESSKIASAIAVFNEENGRNVRFGAIHYSSDYVGLPDETFTSYNLSNEHDHNPQTWKNAVLEDIFNVIAYTMTSNAQIEALME